jgi:hypothetical protein
MVLVFEVVRLFMTAASPGIEIGPSLQRQRILADVARGLFDTARLDGPARSFGGTKAKEGFFHG